MIDVRDRTLEVRELQAGAGVERRVVSNEKHVRLPPFEENHSATTGTASLGCDVMVGLLAAQALQSLARATQRLLTRQGF